MSLLQPINTQTWIVMSVTRCDIYQPCASEAVRHTLCRWSHTAPLPLDSFGIPQEFWSRRWCTWFLDSSIQSTSASRNQIYKALIVNIISPEKVSFHYNHIKHSLSRHIHCPSWPSSDSILDTLETNTRHSLLLRSPFSYMPTFSSLLLETCTSIVVSPPPRSSQVFLD